MSLLSFLRRRAVPEAAIAMPDALKASRTAPLVSLHMLDRPQWSPRNAQALVREGFMKNPVAYRAVRLIAEAVASASFILDHRGMELREHPLLDLVIKPNARQSGAELLEALTGHLLVSGNAYLEVVMLDDVPRELHVLRPDRMALVPGSDGWPAAYDYQVGTRRLRFEQKGPVPPILHITLAQPFDDHFGFAPIEAAASAIDIHNAAASWTKALLDNAARPSGALIYSGGDGHLTAEQFQRLKAEMEEANQGARNAGRPMLLEGGLDWKSMSMSPRDMDFAEAKHGAARDIALAFGIPPMLLGIPGDNTYSNYQEANRAFWRQTVLPLVSRIAQALALWLEPALIDAGSGRLRLRPDSDAVEALSADREALWRRVEAASFLSRNEKREAVGYGAEREPASV